MTTTPAPPLAWYGSSWAYYEPDEPLPTPDQDLDAAADRVRANRLALFRADQFGPRPGGGDTVAVVLGRFLPVHDGHRYLIECARAYAGRVCVFVRVRPDDPVPWPVRRDWLTELFPGVDVLPVEDEATTGAAEWRDLTQRWTERVRAHVTPDYLVTGDDYGPVMAKLLGAAHVPVDRTTIPVSGTVIRADPWAYAAYLPPAVRAYYLRRVCLIGPESSGKSALAARLAGHYGTVHVPEYARTLIERPTADWIPSVIPVIAQGQRATQAALARHASRVLICDTNVLSVRLWSERLYDAAPDWLVADSEADDIDLYLLTAPGLPFQGSASFDRPAERAAFHARCEAELTRLGRRFVPVSGDHEERFAAAVAAVDALLAGA